MKYISLTHIDAGSRIVCTVEPMRVGPVIPDIKGWQCIWMNESTWPIELVDGVYKTPILFYGTCDDDADINLSGVVSVYSQEEFANLKIAEYFARQPFPSWIGDEATMTWQAPVPMPVDNDAALGNYYWDEESLSWKTYGTPVEFMP